MEWRIVGYNVTKLEKSKTYRHHKQGVKQKR